MGLYDTIYATFACPHCGVEAERDCQTKALESRLETYRVGDWIVPPPGSVFIDFGDVVISSIAHCESCLVDRVRAYDGQQVREHPLLDVAIRIRQNVIAGVERVALWDTNT